MTALTANLVLLLACSVAADVWTPRRTTFFVEMEISCSLAKKWCFRVILVEWDRFKNDTIFVIGVLCVDEFESKISIKGDQFGDGLSNFYDLELIITHNCTTDGSIRMFKKSFDAIPVTDSEFKTSFTKDITGLGERVGNYEIH